MKINHEFEYKATGSDAEGKEVEFGGAAATLGDALGGIFSHEGVEVEEWSATEYVDYWVITVFGIKGGERGCEVKYTTKTPKESSAMVAGVATCFDRVTAANVKHQRVNRTTFDAFVNAHEEDFI